jgi:hypothetical protein
MKSIGLLLLLAMTFGLGYRNGAGHNLPDLEPLFGVTTPPRIPLAPPVPPVAPQVVQQVAVASPTPVSWIHDPTRKSALDAPAHNQTGGVVTNGWAQFYTHP